MPLQATSGAASYDAFGGGVPVVPAYIEEVFNTYVWAGNSSSQSINIGFDLTTTTAMTWFKDRTNADGAGIVNNVTGLRNVSYATDAASNPSSYFQFTSTGYNLPSATINTTGSNYVGWTFRKQPKFFDVVTYTGDGNTFQTINHNLGSTPGCIIVKQTNATTNWVVYHRGIGTDTLRLNLTNAKTGLGGAMLPSSTSVDFYGSGGSDPLNASGGTYVAYLFAHNAGGFGLTGTDNVISCGSFTTNGSGLATVNLGYEPQWLLMKATDASNWWVFDNMRNWSKSGFDELNPNLSAGESNYTSTNFSPTATGFQFFGNEYGASRTFIYIAIRRGPMKVPTSGTSVFTPIARTGNGTNTTLTGVGFAPDLVMTKTRAAGYYGYAFDRLRGPNLNLSMSLTDAEDSSVTDALVGFDAMDGVRVGIDNNLYYINGNSQTFINWNFRRAPSFFDEVCYTGTGSAIAQTHNLGVTPEMIIVKSRSAASTPAWTVYVAPLGISNGLNLNTNGAAGSTASPITSTDATTMTIRSWLQESGQTYVAYLFATCAGVSKVGSYTGNGTTQTIDCGFGSGGARFVLIKRTDAAGDWYVYDTARGMTVLTDPYLRLNAPSAETATLGSVTTVSTGFALNSSILAAINVSGGTYIFLAIA